MKNRKPWVAVVTSFSLALIAFQLPALASETVVQCGDVVEESFDKNQEHDDFYIDMEPGDVFYFSTVPVGDFLSFYAEVRDPGGNQMLRVGTGNAPQKNLKGRTGVLSASGRYTVRLHNIYVGVYTVHFGCVLRDGTEIAPGQQPPTPPPQQGSPEDPTDPQVEALLRQIEILQRQIEILQERCPEAPPASPPPTPEDPSEEPRGVTLYEHADFGGRSEFFSEDEKSLRDNLIGRNSASSLRISPGCKVTLYRKENFTGTYIVVDKDVASLRGTEIGNDQVASLEVSCD